MANLLPSTPDTTAADEAEPRVIGLDSEEADALLGAISSSTARELLAALHEEPATASELADAVDTSLQNTQYHLEKLENAGVIEVIDTIYSEKGREMNVFAPADRPLVVFAGREEEETGLRAALSRLLGGLGLLALASAAVQSTVGDWIGVPTAGDSGAERAPGGADEEYGGDGGGGGGGGDAGVAEETKTPDGQLGSFEVEDADDSAEGTPEPTEEPSIAEETPTPEAESTPVPEGEVEATPTETVAETATAAADAAADSGAVLESVAPGLLFFAGGATVLLVVFAIWYLNR